MEHNPEEHYGHWIRKIIRRINNIYDHRLQQYDLTGSQLSVLFQLWKKDGLTQKEIQEILNIRPASVSGLVDTLSSKGFIVRKQDDEDARIKRLYLTEEGIKLNSLCVDIIEEIEVAITEGFSEDEKIILMSWMKKLYKNLHSLQ